MQGFKCNECHSPSFPRTGAEICIGGLGESFSAFRKAFLNKPKIVVGSSESYKELLVDPRSESGTGV